MAANTSARSREDGANNKKFAKRMFKKQLACLSPKESGGTSKNEMSGFLSQCL